MTDTLELIERCKSYLKTLCCDISERCVGSEGNRKATTFFNDELIELGWKTEIPAFDAMDWIDGGAVLSSGASSFKVNVSPYSIGCSEEAELVSATTVEELEKIVCSEKIVFLHGEIAKEQLMPKNFVFYNPEEHQRIIALLESGNPIGLFVQHQEMLHWPVVYTHFL